MADALAVEELRHVVDFGPGLRLRRDRIAVFLLELRLVCRILDEIAAELPGDEIAVDGGGVIGAVVLVEELLDLRGGRTTLGIAPVRLIGADIFV